MPHQYLRSELELAAEDLEAQINKGFIKKEGLSLYRDMLNNHEAITSGLLRFSLTGLDILSIIENILLGLMDAADEKAIHFQLNVLPEQLYCMGDPTITGQMLGRLFMQMLDHADKASTPDIHVSDNDGKCLVEVISQNKNHNFCEAENYFKKHRITPGNETDPSEQLLRVFSKMAEDMGGELRYRFRTHGLAYFRLKLLLY